MSMRCYLFATDNLPELDRNVLNTEPNTESSAHCLEPDMSKDFRGMGEASYLIPLSWKILVSAESRICETACWDEVWDDSDEQFKMAWTLRPAIAGDFTKGVNELANFLEKIESKKAKPLVEETMSYLQRLDVQRKYVYLEPLEVFHSNEPVTNESLEALIKELFIDINNLDGEKQAWIAAQKIKNTDDRTTENDEQVGSSGELKTSDKRTILSRLFGRKNNTVPEVSQPVGESKQCPGPYDDPLGIGLSQWLG